MTALALGGIALIAGYYTGWIKGYEEAENSEEQAKKSMHQLFKHLERKQGERA